MKFYSRYSALGAVLVLGTAFASADTITLVSSNTPILGNPATATQFVSETGNNAPNGVTPYNAGFFPGPSQPGLGVSGTATDLTGTVTPTWAAPLSQGANQSSWVSYAQTGPGNFLQLSANGNYWFTQTFTTLASETYSGSLDVLADDTVAVFLNGVQQNFPTNPLGFPHCSAGAPSCMNPLTGTPVTLDSADFNVGGLNTLTFQLVQGGGADLGLDYAGLVTGVPINPTVPEPSTLLLLGTGLIGSAGVLMRRMRA